MPTIFKKITDLTPAVVITGTEVMEFVHNPGGPEEESQSITSNALITHIAAGLTFTVDIVMGSPDGVTAALPGKLVFDNTPPGALWIKTSGTDASGWLQLI
jgi:hypothetical protein